MSYRDESVSFRFFALSASQAAELLNLRPDATSRPARGRKGCVIGTFVLEAGVNYDWIARFIEQNKIPEEDYGIFVSISTSSDSDVVRLPRFAAELSRSLGGVIDFSFTSLPEND